jgi:hypothetical protein
VRQAGSPGCGRAESQAKRLIAPNDDLKPTTNGERLALAELCQIKKLYRVSAGLSAGAASKHRQRVGARCRPDPKAFPRFSEN